MPRLTLIVLILFAWAAPAWSQDVNAGDWVTLHRDSPNGVPVHRQASNSRFTSLENGARAEVTEVAENGRWLHVVSGEVAGWVIIDYARRIPPPTLAPDVSPLPSLATDEFDPTASLACDTGGNDLLRRLEDEYFTVCFHTGLRIPIWVAYKLTHDIIDGPGDRNASSWRQDPVLEEENPDFQAYDQEYKGSGFQRGHMAPADDFTRSQEAMDATFRFINAVPQRQSVNTGGWRSLEGAVQNLVEPDTTAWIVTGAALLEMPDNCDSAAVSASCVCLDAAGGLIDPAHPPRRLKGNRVAIPSHTWKAIYVVRGDEHLAYGFVLPNVDYAVGTHRRFQYSIDTLEAHLQIDLFASADGEDLIDESRLDPIDPDWRRARCRS